MSDPCFPESAFTDRDGHDRDGWCCETDAEYHDMVKARYHRGESPDAAINVLYAYQQDLVEARSQRARDATPPLKRHSVTDEILDIMPGTSADDFLGMPGGMEPSKAVQGKAAVYGDALLAHHREGGHQGTAHVFCPGCRVGAVESIQRRLTLDFHFDPTQLDPHAKGWTYADGTSDAEREQGEGYEPPVASWAPQDIEDILDGTFEQVEPEFLEREDEVALLYPGLVHSMHGESESGKSLIVQWGCAVGVIAGDEVTYIDYESDRETVVGRLLLMGCTPEQVRERFTYIHPEQDFDTSAQERAAFEALLETTPSVVIIDGVTDSLGQSGLSSIDNDDNARWLRKLPRRIAKETGAAVVLVDHVTKSSESRGRFAIGGQAKMAGLDGAAYVVDVIEPAGRGRVGRLTLRIAKDRPGAVRGECGAPRKGDRTQEAAVIIVDGTTPGAITMRITPPEELDEEAVERRAQSKTAGIMRAIVDELRVHPGASATNLKKSVTGRDEDIARALRGLVEDGYVEVRPAARGAHHHHLTDKPFALVPTVLPTVINATEEH